MYELRLHVITYSNLCYVINILLDVSFECYLTPLYPRPPSLLVRKLEKDLHLVSYSFNAVIIISYEYLDDWYIFYNEVNFITSSI